MLSEKPWKPEAVLRLGICLFASLCIGLSAISLIRFFNDTMSPQAERVLAFAVGTFSFQLASLGFVHVFLREHGIGWSAAFGFRSPRPGHSAALAVLSTTIALPIALALGQASEFLMRSAKVEPVTQQTVQTLQLAESPMLICFFGIVAIGLAPIAEEILFRGIIYPTVKQLGFPKLALWGTTVLFAVSHTNVVTTIPLMFFSLLLTLLYERTDNLMAPILSHSLFNATNFFLVHQASKVNL